MCAKGRQVAFLGQRSVNGSVEWLDVPQPFCDTGVATAAWTENLYVDPWIMRDIPAGIPDNPFNLRAVARRSCDNILQTNRLERFQTLSRKTLSRCLSDTCDEVMFDDDWLKGDWYLAD